MHPRTPFHKFHPIHTRLFPWDGDSDGVSSQSASASSDERHTEICPFGEAHLALSAYQRPTRKIRHLAYTRPPPSTDCITVRAQSRYYLMPTEPTILPVHRLPLARRQTRTGSTLGSITRSAASAARLSLPLPPVPSPKKLSMWGMGDRGLVPRTDPESTREPNDPADKSR